MLETKEYKSRIGKRQIKPITKAKIEWVANENAPMIRLLNDIHETLLRIEQKIK